MNSKHVVVSGSSGLIGRALVDSYTGDGVRVVRLVRRAPRTAEEVEWQPGGRLDPAALAEAQAVINLNGASIGRLPWTRKYRKQLIHSRLKSTRTLAAALRELGPDAPHFISGSAVGFYGHRPGESLTEQSDAGDTFLARLCVAWEREAAASGAPLSLLRTAPVLHPDGVLKPLIAMTRLGVSGPLGNGNQAWPWISLEDQVRAIRHIADRRVLGPVNLTGPGIASANDIGRQLAQHLSRPFWLRAPAFTLRLGLGRDAADSLLLSDARVDPTALTGSGFEFSHPTPRDAIEAVA